MEIRNQLQSVSDALCRDIVKLAGAHEILVRIENGVNDQALSFVVGQLEPLLNDIVARHDALEALLADDAPSPGPERQAQLLETLERADDLASEAMAAELLDQVLQARADYAAIGDEMPLPGQHFGPRQLACDAREDAAAAELIKLDVTKPGVALAAFICGASLGDGPLMYAGLELDFERARDRAGDYFWERLVVDFVAGLERRCAGGPVAAVIAKHRKLAEERYARQEAAE